MIPGLQRAMRFRAVARRGGIRLAGRGGLAMALWLAVAGVSPAGEEAAPTPVRVAVIDQAKGSALADLLFDALAKSGRFELVERNRIELVLREQQTSALSRDCNVTIGRMLKADAILFVEADPCFRHVSLVETARGERLMDTVCPASDDGIEEPVRAIADRVCALQAKFVVPAAQRRYIAILPFSQEGEAARWTVLRSLPVMVESRLAAAPSIVIVEREHLTTLVREVNLAKEDAADFSRADYLVRGAFAFRSADRASVRILVQSVADRDGGKTNTFELVKTDPAPAVEAMARWIAETIRGPAPVRGVSADEAAAHYANAMVFQAQGRPDPFRSLEMAYWLQPTNRIYAAAYVAALAGRWERWDKDKRRFAELFDYLNLAIDVSRRADPERIGSPLPRPAFMARVPQNVKEAAAHRFAILPFEDTRGGAFKGEAIRGRRVLQSILAQWAAVQILDEKEADRAAQEAGVNLIGGFSTWSLGKMAGKLNVEAVIGVRIGGDAVPKLTHLCVTPGMWFGSGFDGQPGEDVESLAEKTAERLIGYRVAVYDGVSPAEYEAFLDCRRHVEEYYRWWCDAAGGWPDKNRRMLFAAACPLFLDGPEAVVKTLKEIVGKGDFEAGNLDEVERLFLDMTSWDRGRALEAWIGFLNGLAADGPAAALRAKARLRLPHVERLRKEMDEQTRALRALAAAERAKKIADEQATDLLVLWENERSRAAAIEFLKWASADATNLACFASRVNGQHPLWPSVLGGEPRERMEAFDHAILPAVLATRPSVHGESILDLLAGWLAANAGHSAETKRVEAILGKTLGACKTASSYAYDRLLAHIRDRWPTLAPLAGSHPIPKAVTAGPQTAVDLDGVELKLCWCPAGTFMMGSPPDEGGHDQSETLHPVTLTRGFWLGQYEVTQAQWEAVMGNNPSMFVKSGRNAPVEMVTWDDCQEFLRRLNTRAERNGRKGGFRLPTDAEWEYACRAGTMGSHAGDVDAMAWHAGNAGGTTHAVGLKRANAWNLYDMHGNVWEWVSDYSGCCPSATGVTDPTGPASGACRGFRGGCWPYDAEMCRSAKRAGYWPGVREGSRGLRVARDGP